MNTNSQPLNERLSALMDGELPASELDALLRELAEGDADAKDWHLYHLTGDVMRSQALAPQPADLAFLGRFEQRLRQEPITSPAPSLPQAPAVVVEAPARVAANGPWRWAAGMTLTLLLGAVSVGLWQGATPSAAPQFASAPSAGQSAMVQQGTAVMLRDPELDALMAAHQQMGGHSAWQMPSGFLRNATFERPAR